MIRTSTPWLVGTCSIGQLLGLKWVRGWSFPEFKDTNDEFEFTQMIKVRHNNVVPTMALGVQQLKKGRNAKIDYEDLEDIHQFLDRFYLSIIGIHMLIGLPILLTPPLTRYDS